jgi:hypothetical protein
MYTDNTGGLNVTDSPLRMKDSQATGQSFNYDYSVTGAITKVLASAALNSSPDSNLKSVGLGVYHSASTDARTAVRCAGTKIQTFDTSTGAFTNLAEDTSTAGTTFLDSSTTQPVVFAPFNTATGTQLWMAGGGMSSIYGYTGTNITANGTPVPTGSLGATVNTAAGGTYPSAGVYYCAVAFRKLGTQTISNCALDVSATLANTTDTITLDLSSINNIDSTKYDRMYIYRSAVSGVSGFTTGDFVTSVPMNTTSVTLTGNYTTTATSVPRAGSTSLDNSVLTLGTYKYVTAFKRRLVTALGSTIYLSDLNKPESWPTANSITIPTGGPITALGVIGVPSEYTTGADEYLCIWKEDELWVLTGSSSSDWALLFVDKTGCLGQSLVVPFNGYVSWIGFTGIYLWDGRGQPTRCSRPIQSLFMNDGDIDKTKLSQGFGVHYRKANQVIWRLSHRVKGTQKLSIKMDTRLTSVKGNDPSSKLQNPEFDGVYIADTDSNAYYAACSYKAASGDETLFLGDDAGYVYTAFSSAAAVSFAYETRPLDMGSPQTNKRFKRVIAYVEKVSVNDLTLNYWADNRVRSEYMSTVKATMAPLKGSQPALWDIGIWDIAYWDDYTAEVSPIEFNLHAQENNSEGFSLKLKFSQTEASAPVRIHGFAVEWEDMGVLSIPTQQAV